MTLLIASILPDTAESAPLLAGAAWHGGADAVEIRIDRLPEEDIAQIHAYLLSNPGRQFIVTCRSTTEGGFDSGSAEVRAARLRRAVAGTNALIDFELADWLAHPHVRAGLLGGSVDTARGESAAERDIRDRLILSTHHFHGVLPDLRSKLVAARNSHPQCVVKAAFTPQTISETFLAADLLREGAVEPANAIAIAMGEEGLWTRILAKKLGAFGACAALDAPDATAPGQPSLAEIRHTYRWNQIDKDTEVFGVVGDPVADSKGPVLFNHWFEEAGINAVYVLFRVRDVPGACGSFLESCLSRPWLSVRGLSVTIPHKSAVLDWLTGGSGNDRKVATSQTITAATGTPTEAVSRRADRTSALTGAVNTLVFRAGSVSGFNTDVYAAVASLACAMGRRTTDLVDYSFDVLGGGGAARAVLAGLNSLGCRMTVYGRTADRAQRLAEEFHSSVADWELRGNHKAAVLINCTSVGTWPNVDDTPMPADRLAGYGWVFDLIYNPLETRLLRDAAAAGAATLNGLDMFFRQAAAQFELWTGRQPNLTTGRHVVVESLAQTSVDRRPTDATARYIQSLPTIALIGYRGSGKTCVARILAQLLGGECADTDSVVAAEANRSVADIFAADGEGEFRRRERDALAAVLARRPAAVSTGGGIVLDPVNVERLRAQAVVIWLTAPPEELLRRVESDPATSGQRPRLSPHDSLSEVRSVLANRLGLYRQAADFAVDTLGESPQVVAQEILDRLGALGWPMG